MRGIIETKKAIEPTNSGSVAFALLRGIVRVVLILLQSLQFFVLRYFWNFPWRDLKEVEILLFYRMQR